MVHALLSALPQRTEDPAFAEALGPVYDTSGVMRVLGVTKQAVDDRRRKGSILALRTSDDVWVYPAFQFETNRVHPGLLPAVRALSDSPPWASALWFVTPNEHISPLWISFTRGCPSNMYTRARAPWLLIGQDE